MKGIICESNCIDMTGLAIYIYEPLNDFSGCMYAMRYQIDIYIYIKYILIAITTHL